MGIDRTGTYRIISSVGEEVKAYIPPPLPPHPPLDLAIILPQLERASHALGEAKGLFRRLGHPMLFGYMTALKEALLSSQIEGSQSSISDLLLFEIGNGSPNSADETREVQQLMKATRYALQELRGGLPICIRLLCRTHEILLDGVRGQHKLPGQFRRSQNWIGGTRPGNASYVPPPALNVPGLMSDLENFIHDDKAQEPLLIKAALVHAQFETIHPFLDGNGRVGRLLILLMLISGDYLEEPVLYVSLFFKKYRRQYYDLLQRVRLQGDWESWTRFFLQGIEEAALEVANSGNDLLNLFEEDTGKVELLGRGAPTALRVHQQFMKSPIQTIPHMSGQLRVSYNAVAAAIARLERIGLVREWSDPHQRRSRTFVYSKYLSILGQDGDPL